jgi:transposase
MITPRSDLKVVVATQPIDFRKGVHGLVALVAEALKADPYCGDVFVFRSKRKNRLKLLVWDGSGLLLATKWLEDGGFPWPPVRDGAVRLSAVQFALLLDGLEWRTASPPLVKKPCWLG